MIKPVTATGNVGDRDSARQRYPRGGLGQYVSQLQWISMIHPVDAAVRGT